jgi:hypothetical protein
MKRINVARKFACGRLRAFLGCVSERGLLRVLLGLEIESAQLLWGRL